MMGTDARQPPITKKVLVGHGLRGLAKYRRELAVDLLFGQVPIPARWLTEDQMTFVTLREEEVPKTEVCTGGRALVAAVVRLCDQVIPGLIEDYLRRHAVPARLERDSLRRGSGPAAARGAIFHSCPSWPQANLEGLEQPIRSAVDSALDAALARRRTWQRPDLALALDNELATAVETRVRAYARQRRLSDDDERWLLSEVFNQLIRNVDRGRPPRDVARWTAATAAKKFNRRTAIDGPAPSRRPPSNTGRTDEEPTDADLMSTLIGSGKRLAKLAADLRAIGDEENAAIHDVSATILIMESVDGVTSFLEDGDSVSDRLREQGLNLSPARRMAAVELIKATLKDALR
jgi:hypothetical protein